MLIGEYNKMIDAKGRFNFPIKLRENLGTRFIITKGLGDNCLFVYSTQEWQLVEDKLKKLPFSKARNLQRFFFASALEVEPDSQGRVVIPASLREYANITNEAVIVGASSHCEIWSVSNWKKVEEQLDAETIATAMDELGF
ncbi:MAG: division/cell wall cluster transcriptional repressor MraZ [Oscillospiraceae bacterium]